MQTLLTFGKSRPYFAGMRTPLCLGVSVAILLLSLAACSRRASGPVVGVTLLTKEHVFYNEMEQAMRQEAEKAGMQLVVTSGDWDLARQQNQIKDFITRKVSAMVVCPVNSSGIASAIAEAKQAGIPVFTADIKAIGAPVVCHIASNNREGGRMAANFMAKLLADKKEAKVAIIGQPEVETAQERTAGFEEAMKQYPNIQVVATPSGGGVRDRSMRAAEDVLQGFPDIAGIFGINDDSALGAVAAIESSGKKGIVVVGFDATPEAREAIKRGGPLKGDIAQQPREIGKTTIDEISRYLKGEQVPPNIEIPVQLVDH